MMSGRSKKFSPKISPMRIRRGLVILGILCVAVVFLRYAEVETSVYDDRIVCKRQERRFDENSTHISHEVDMPATTLTDSEYDKRHWNRKPAFLCSYDMGRLGNTLFSYASMFGVAKGKNMTPSFCDRQNLLYSIFKHPTAVRNNNKCRGFSKHRNAQHCAFNSDDIKFNSKKNSSMRGYYQSWKYFKNNFNDIRKEFTFTDEIQNEARDAIRKVLIAYNSTAKLTFVMVHARRSDILENSGYVKYGFLSPGREYYKKAMDLYRLMYDPVVFIVCSDRINWAKQQFDLRHRDVFFVEGHRPPVDMCVLSQGNHTIMSVGTFGWWGSFLANGNTIAYKQPARNGSQYRKQFSNDLSDYFLPHWTLLGD